MPTKLERAAKEKGIEYFLISFVDILGKLRSKMVPARAIGPMEKNGAGFAGFAAYLNISPADGDTMAVPDPDSLIQLPWRPEVGWLASDLYLEGEPVQASPRVALKNQLAKAEKLGYRMKTGVECEFFLINPDGSALADSMDTDAKPCYDQHALMRVYPYAKEMCDAMLKMGFSPYQLDHEDANGQYEMNWDYDDALKTADRHVFFKYMTRELAERHGMRATYMPKPFPDRTGSGCHAHISLWDKTGKKNMFAAKKDELGLSPLAYDFLGGIMKHTRSLAAIFNPTVNSYKRIKSGRVSSGCTYSPTTITFGGNNRTHMIRVPGGGRFELRLMDGAANPYLMQAGMLAAGLDGIEHKIHPGKPLHINMYEEGHTIKSTNKLPTDLQEALGLLNKSKAMREAFGDELIDTLIRFKEAEWDEYSFHLTDWERENTLDC
jgi:glutamine synthetase